MSRLLNRFRHHIAIIGINFLIVAVFMANTARWIELGFIDQLEYFLYDLRVVFTMPGEVDQTVVIVDIDEKSLAEIGRWPWSRDWLAKMVDELFETYGVIIVGFDMIFREPDESSGLRILDQLAKNEFAGINEYQNRLNEIRPYLDFDQMYIDSISKGPVVLGFTVFSEKDNVDVINDGSLPPPLFTSEDFEGKFIHAPNTIGYGANMPEIQSKAIAGGHITPEVDVDGRVRRVPMLINYDGDYYESLSLAIIRTLYGLEKITPIFVTEGVSSEGEDYFLDGLAIGGYKIPVDVNVHALVPFQGREYSFPYVSAVDVIKGRVDKEILQGAIVIVGTTSKGLVDLRPTPVNEAYPGVEIHANLITGILNEDIKGMPSSMRGIEFIELLILGVLLSLILPLLSPVFATLFTGALFTGSILFNLHLWINHDLVTPLSSSLTMIMVVFVITMLYGFFIERRGKQQLSGLFGQYVPPELVDEMSEDPTTYNQDAQSKEMSVLFTDVRNFTTISEGLSPQELSDLMDAYLTPMTKIIHDNRGTIDKYIGDAIMAFWNAPVSDEKHASNAVKTGLEMLERTSAIREEFLEKGWPEIRIGAGINTGVMSVGDMGSEFRMAYTVLGDAVNLGSRLEGLTKGYGVEMIVSESTKAAASEYTYRELDVVRVKGKDEPIAIFEPVALTEDISDEEFKELVLQEQAMKNYYAQNWDEAELEFNQLLDISPDRKLYYVYLDRIEEYRLNPPGDDWDGVFTFTTK